MGCCFFSSISINLSVGVMLNFASAISFFENFLVFMS